MSKRQYPPEVKAEAIDMYMGQVPIEDISGELQIPYETVRSWVQGRRDGGDMMVVPAKVRSDKKEFSERELNKDLRKALGNTMRLTSGLLERALREREQDPRPITMDEAQVLSGIAAKLLTGLRVYPALRTAEMEEFDDPTL